MNYVAKNISSMIVIVIHDECEKIVSMIMVEIVNDIAIFHRFCSNGTIKGIGFSTLLPFAERLALSIGCTKAKVQVIVHDTTKKLLQLYVQYGYNIIDDHNGSLSDCIDSSHVKLQTMIKMLK
jgi:hypothetical protein